MRLLHVAWLVFVSVGCTAAGGQIVTVDASPRVRELARSYEFLVLRAGAVEYREVRQLPEDGEFPFVYTLADEHRGGATLVCRAYATIEAEPIARTTLVRGYWPNGDTVRLYLATPNESYERQQFSFDAGPS